MAAPDENPAFERWCYAARDPLVPAPFATGENAPYLTTFLYRVCGDDPARFDEGLRILQAAFEGGQAAGRAEIAP